MQGRAASWPQQPWPPGSNPPGVPFVNSCELLSAADLSPLTRAGSWEGTDLIQKELHDKAHGYARRDTHTYMCR